MPRGGLSEVTGCKVAKLSLGHRMNRDKWICRAVTVARLTLIVLRALGDHHDVALSPANDNEKISALGQCTSL